MKFYIGDIRDLKSCENCIKDCDLVFHAAALKQVPSCEFYPLEAVKTNIIGTLNVLESLKNAKSLKAIVSVTTDKVYQNKKQIWGYRETDALGGNDPYSGSKSCADLVAQSYFHSFFQKSSFSHKLHLEAQLGCQKGRK